MFVLKKNTLIIISVLLACALTAALCFSALYLNPVGKSDGGGVKIVLDAGHGGIDGGVIGAKTGVKESELNLAVVKNLEKLFLSAGFSVVLTRGTSAGLYGVATKNLKRKDMEKRREIILNANPTLVISVHMNKFGSSSRRGAQVFFKDGNTQSENLALSIQNSFNGMETSIRNYAPLSGDYYILNCSEYPSVIAECGFLSNPEDESLLITEEYREEISYAIFKGVIGYLSEQSFVFCD